MDLFTTKGFGHTSLREIADRLGLTKAALYYHFPSKADLVRSLVEPFFDDVEEFLDKAEAADAISPPQLLASYVDMLYAYRDVFVMLLRDASVLAHMDLEARSLKWLDRLLQLLVGTDATPAQQVRATVAVGGASRAILMLTENTIDELRGPAVEAACAALGVPGPDTVE